MAAIPTASDLKSKLPFFVAVADGTVTEFIAEAARSVDATWTEGDQANATMYLAAHLMFSLGAASAGGAPPGAGGGGGPVQSESIGDSSVSYAATSFLRNDGSALEDYRSTVWGRRYLQLLRLNQPGPVIA